MIRGRRQGSLWPRFCGAGVSPAVLGAMFESKPAGGTPSPQKPVFYRDAAECGAFPRVRVPILRLGE
jgi:hypothetical protein